MYERSSLIPREERECRPDYAKQAEMQAGELKVIKDFRKALLDFIRIIKGHSINRNTDGIPTLLGNIEIDIIEREDRLKATLELAEKYQNKD